MTPQAHIQYTTHTNKLIHKKSSSQQQAVIILIIAENDINGLKFAPSCVSVCFCGCRNLPDTFIEDVEFVICQTFLLEDGYDRVVDAAT